MSFASEFYESKLAGLPIGERAELAHLLLQSLDAHDDKSGESAWEAELQRRIEGVVNGTAATLTHEEVFHEFKRDSP